MAGLDAAKFKLFNSQQAASFELMLNRDAPDMERGGGAQHYLPFLLDTGNGEPARRYHSRNIAGTKVVAGAMG